jgi:hypothetical protein
VPRLTSGRSAPARRRSGFLRPLRRVAPGPAAAVSDAQILALVSAAERLSQRQRARAADVSTTVDDEGLLRLDWAVQAGRLAIADRASTKHAAAGPDQAGTL